MQQPVQYAGPRATDLIRGIGVRRHPQAPLDGGFLPAILLNLGGAYFVQMLLEHGGAPFAVAGHWVITPRRIALDGHPA
jgi:hypothetical protein